MALDACSIGKQVFARSLGQRRSDKCGPQRKQSTLPPLSSATRRLSAPTVDNPRFFSMEYLCHVIASVSQAHLRFMQTGKRKTNLVANLLPTQP